MDLKATLSQVAGNYAAARPATAPQPGTGTGLLGDLARDFAATLARGEATAIGAMTGRADPHALV